MVGADPPRRAGLASALLGAAAHGPRRARAARRRAWTALAELGVAEYADRLPGELPFAVRSGSRWPARWSARPRAAAARRAGRRPRAPSDMAELGRADPPASAADGGGAGRAPHGPGDGASATASWCSTSAGVIADGHARPRCRPTRACSTPTSARRRPPMLEVEDLGDGVRAGAARCDGGLARRSPAGAITAVLGANGAGQDHAAAHALRPACGPRAGRIRSTGATSRGRRGRGDRPARDGPRARGPRRDRRADRGGEPAPRRRCGAATGADARRALDEVYELFPRLAERARAAGQHALRRRAADARRSAAR